METLLSSLVPDVEEAKDQVLEGPELAPPGTDELVCHQCKGKEEAHGDQPGRKDNAPGAEKDDGILHGPHGTGIGSEDDAEKEYRAMR